MSGLNKAIIYKTDTGKTLILKYDDTFIVNPEPEPIVVPNLDLSHEFGIGPGGSGDDTYCGWYIFAIDADTGEYYELKQEEWDVQITLTNSQGEIYQLTENDYRFGDYWDDEMKNEITVFFPSRKFEHPYSTYQMEAKLISKIDSSKVFTSSGEPKEITENFTIQSIRSAEVYAQEPEYNDDESSCLVKVTTEFNLCNILGDWRFELRPSRGDTIQITDFVVSEDFENRINYGPKDFTFGPYTFEDNGSIDFQLYMISPNGTEYFIYQGQTQIECKDVLPKLDYNTVFGIDAGSSSWHTLGWELYVYNDDGDYDDYYFDPDKWDATLTITNSDGESYVLENALESDGSIFVYENYSYRYIIYLPLKEFTKSESTYTFTLVCTLKIDTTKSITLSDSYELTYDTIVQGIPDRNISYDGPNYNDDNTQCSVNVYGDMYLYNIYGDWKIKLRDNLDNEIDIDYETVDDEHGSNYVNCDFNEPFNYDYSDNGDIECHLILVDPNGVEYDMMDTNYTIECSEPEDTVDIGGKTYRTVTIGNQTWLAQNLDLETDSGSVESDRRSDNEDYGRLYQWNKAVEVVNSIEGWHLPTRAEWNILRDFVGVTYIAGTKLKSTSGWSSGNGTDDFGFGVLPAGYYNGSSYSSVGSYAGFWTSEEYSSSFAYFKYFDRGSSMNEGNYNLTYYNSVRLIKDN